MHRSSWRSTPALALAFGLALSACSGSDDDDGNGNPYTGGNLDPTQLCSNVAADQCDKIYSCVTDANQLRSLGFPATKTDCLGNAIDQLRCTSATATNICGGTAIGAQQVAACSNQVKAASCDQVSKSSNVAEYAKDCGPCAFHR